MDNIPLTRFVDPRRSLAVVVLVIGISLAMALMGTSALGLRVRASDIHGFLESVTVIAIIYTVLIRTVTRRIFRDELDAFKALNRSDYAEALELQLKFLALIEKHPWLDRWRTVLFLSTSPTSFIGQTLANAADLSIRVGKIEEGMQMCERCLAQSPKNVQALTTANMVNLFMGGPLRPQHDIELRYAFDRGRRSLLRYAPNALLLLPAIFLLFSMMYLLVRVQRSAVISFLFPETAAMVVVLVFPAVYRWVSRHALLPDMERGFELVRQGDYAGAIDAFGRQVESLVLNPYLDKWRKLLLFEPSAYTYREWALLYMITPCVQLGQIDRIAALYEECLKLNPDNIYGRSGLELFQKIQASAMQSQGA